MIEANVRSSSNFLNIFSDDKSSFLKFIFFEIPKLIFRTQQKEESAYQMSKRKGQTEEKEGKKKQKGMFIYFLLLKLS